MIKYSLYIFIFFLLSEPANAQGGPNNVNGPLRQFGTITIGDCASWKANNLLQDSGSACGGGSGGITALTGVITASGTGSVVSSFGSFSSATLAAALTDETGTGSAVFGTSPTISGANLSGSTSIGTSTFSSFPTITPANIAGVITIGSSGVTADSALGNTLAIKSNTLVTQDLINAQTGTSYTVSCTTDPGKTITQNNASASAYTIPVATTTGCGAGASFSFINYGAGTETLTPTTSTINGLSSLSLPQYASAYIVSDGTNYVAFQGAPTGGGGSGTVNSGTQYQIGYYATNGTAISGQSNITTDANSDLIVRAATATALAIGTNGTTNPAFAVDTSTASAVSGLVYKAATTGGTGTLTATDSGATAPLTIVTKGAATLTLSTGATGAGISIRPGNGAGGSFAFLNSGTSFAPAANNAAATPVYLYTIPAPASLTASTSAPIFNIGSTTTATRTHVAGALALQPDNTFYGAVDAFASASTQTLGYTLGATYKDCGANGTCTTIAGIDVPTYAFTGAVGTGAGIYINAPTGATNNYAAIISGDIAMLGTAPAVSTCGGGTIATGSTDHRWTVTGITAATACTVTFHQVLPAGAVCVYSTSTGIAVGGTTSTTATTTTMVALTGSLSGVCF